ncbi:M23 family metallopeptidase [Leifsonia aquatica]|uniref:M23 family metallopeptidase n=1 Tax=Leifsonia aquatica TaxID=144185 RepID=UPI00046A7323|nr:M23 family metallopeptidase [Leifsonia aquatica]
MVKKLLILVLVLFCVGPSAAVVTVAAFAGPLGFCTTGSLTVGEVPDELTATTADGVSVTLEKRQLTHAATIITTGAGIPGVGQAGVRVALIAALTESRLRMLANTGTYPESGSFPNDGNGSDHDSLGLFQMRPASGWGTVAELMDPTYQARAFFGGKDGPNYPSPRGLLDIPGWQQLDPGSAAQAVEVSAFPDRYRNWQPVADAILAALIKPAPTSGTGTGGPGPVPETSRIVFPLPAGSYTSTDSFGWRTDPFTGEHTFHSGSDLAAPAGTPISAIADGRVTVAEYTGGWGGLIVIEHTVDGVRVASYYAHMWQDGIFVTNGETVTAGQHIGDVGSSGRSTGPHLHVEIRPGGQGQPPVNAVDWLTAHGAKPGEGTGAPTGCRARVGGES